MGLKGIKHLQVITTEALYTLDVAMIGFVMSWPFPLGRAQGTVLTISMTMVLYLAFPVVTDTQDSMDRRQGSRQGFPSNGSHRIPRANPLSGDQGMRF